MCLFILEMNRGWCKNVNAAVLFHGGIRLFARLCSDTNYHYKTCTIVDSPCSHCRLWMCVHRLRWSLLSVKSSFDHQRLLKLPQLHTEPWICWYDHPGNITSHWGQKHQVSVNVCTIQSLGIRFHSRVWIWITFFAGIYLCATKTVFGDLNLGIRSPYEFELNFKFKVPQEREYHGIEYHRPKFDWGPLIKHINKNSADS